MKKLFIILLLFSSCCSQKPLIEEKKHSETNIHREETNEYREETNEKINTNIRITELLNQLFQLNQTITEFDSLGNVTKQSNTNISFQSDEEKQTEIDEEQDLNKDIIESGNKTTDIDNIEDSERVEKKKLPTWIIIFATVGVIGVIYLIYKFIRWIKKKIRK